MGKRFFRHGELHLVLLTLLSRRPMHGYELMGELGRLFGPGYRPSAGSVYPAVEGLETEGLVVGHEGKGGRRVYELTPVGTGALDQRADRLAALEVRTGVHLGHRNLDASLARFTSRVQAVAARIDPDTLDTLLAATAAEIEQRALSTRPRNPTQEQP